ncbi:hypothetical protein LUZ60_009494 [Juncus effusus]|nr:hypothetical protein LUZ60_009494 [Juncus effusus]
MERKVKVVCAIVGFLGLLSVSLAFAGEGTKVTLNDVQKDNSGQCMYPRSPAEYLGFISALCLLIAQIFINTAAGCFCCKRRAHSSGSKRVVALICFLVSWVTFVLGFLILLAAAAFNDKHYKNGLNDYNNYCVVLKSGVFSGGAILSLATIILGLAYYILLKSSNNALAPQANQGIGTGVPHVPPQGTDPVSVHEDAYDRSQCP